MLMAIYSNVSKLINIHEREIKWKPKAMLYGITKVESVKAQ